MLEDSGVPYILEVIGFVDWEEGVKGTTPQGKVRLEEERSSVEDTTPS